MLQLLWIIKGMFLKALKVKLPNNPAVPVLSDTQKRWKAGSQGDSLITLCIAVHNILSHNNSNVYPQDKGLNKMYYVHKVDYLWIFKMKEILRLITAQMNLEGIMPNAAGQ